jgi:glycosyltransferase involved in cell wall biosynthesis
LENAFILKWLTPTDLVFISCIIPTRNRPDFVVQAAASVLAQTHQTLELIIINDGTVDVPAFHDTRVRVLISNEAGAVPARNLGLAAARGEAIAWLDDDDCWSDVHFLSDADKLLSHSADFVFGDGHLVFPDGKRKPFAEDADAHSLTSDNTILISSVVYATSLHSALGVFDTTLPYYWDWDWYLRVARAGHRIIRHAKPVVDIRIHANNMSGTANAPARKANLDLFARKHGLPEITLKSHLDFV